MKKFTLLLTVLLFSAFTMSQQAETISGTVSNGTDPMKSVNVSILNKDMSTITDARGKYEIKAAIGDIIQFSYVGMLTIDIRVEDVTKTLNIGMIPKVEKLDEVTVSGKIKDLDEEYKSKSQEDLFYEFNNNKNLIRTGFGILDKERSGFAMTIVDGEDLNLAGSDFTYALPGILPGISVVRPLGSLEPLVYLPRRFMSFQSPRPVLYEVDGNLYTEAPVFLQTADIKRIAVIGSAGALTRYGTMAAGGLIIINTKSGNFSPTKEQIIEREKQPLDEMNPIVNALSREEVSKNAPTYLKELGASGSFEESKAVFERYHSIYSNSPYFLLDAYTHFVEMHDEVAYADKIISENFGRYTNNPVLMKALAYTYESQQRYEKANDIYKEVFILRPNYVQSYMDMANSYINLNEIRQAASMYARYNYLIEEGFLEHDSIVFGPIIERDVNNLLALAKDDMVDIKKAEKALVVNKGFEGTRLVFEWNDGEAEFELQIVNPENQYMKWKHSMTDGADEVEREKDYGYNVQEYLLENFISGIWKVNINYLGNKSLTPTYLKATVYQDYGSKTQKKEVKLFKLDLKNVNQELFSVTANSGKLVR